jgi:hypothetical protein
MRKPVIVDIIKRDGLKPGDAMRSLGGVEIEGSRVLDERTVIYPDGPHFVLATQNVIMETETQLLLSAEAMEQLRSF